MSKKARSRSIMDHANDPVTASPGLEGKIKRRTLKGSQPKADPEGLQDVRPDNDIADPNRQLKERFKNAEMIAVCCKLPSGLRCRCYATHEKREVGPFGTVTTSLISVPVPGEEFVLAGTSQGRGTDFRPRLFFGGYSVTLVPESLWTKWYETVGKHMDCCINNLVFARKSERDAKAAGKDHAAVFSGLSPLRPPVRDKNGTLVGQPDPRIKTENILNHRFLEVGSNDGALQG
jgi:hypothetical protein